VNQGELVALVGSNGAGKSTTLRTISGLLRPVVGEVWLDGRRIDRLAPEKIVAAGVSHLPEGRGIFPTLSVAENLQMGYYTKRGDRSGYKNSIEQAVALFPRLGERMGQAAGTLSGGEQQMLALARALLPNPRLLMIDELSLGLAPVVVQMLFERLSEINAQGTTVLLVEQYVNLALRVADRAYVLSKGTVALEGSAAELSRDTALVRSSYLGGHGDAPPAVEDELVVEPRPIAKKRKSAPGKPAAKPPRRATTKV
ncbi:MAG: ABC transporter ATP-binding protein, partial [Actinomycetota bacterium]